MYKLVLYDALGMMALVLQVALLYCFRYNIVSPDMYVVAAFYFISCVTGVVVMLLHRVDMRLFWILFTLIFPGFSLLMRDISQRRTYLVAGVFFWFLFCFVVSVFT